MSIVFGALGAVIAWIALNFVGSPIRRFWDLRGQVARKANEHSRFISGPPSLAIALHLAEKTDRESAIRDFKSLGLDLIAFADGEPLAAYVLSIAGFHVRPAGRLFLELADSLGSNMSLGPRRMDLLGLLKLQP